MERKRKERERSEREGREGEGKGKEGRRKDTCIDTEDRIGQVCEKWACIDTGGKTWDKIYP